LTATASPETLTWSGAVGAKWSTPGNWNLSGGRHRAPINGDDLVFPANAANLANTDDLVSLSLHSLLFSGNFTTATGGYTIGGNDLTIGAGGISDNGTIGNILTGIVNQIDFNMVLGTAQTWSINDNNHFHKLVIGGSVDNKGFGLTAAGNGEMSLTGQISGQGGHSVTQTANSLLDLELHHLNTYTGGTAVKSGILDVFVDGALGPGGANDAGTNVASFGTLFLENVAYNTAENLILNGTLENASGNSSFAGPINVPASPGGKGSGLPIPVNAAIENFAQGASTFTLNGPTLVDSGPASIFLEGSDSTLGAGSNLVINNAINGAGGLLLQSATVQLKAANTEQGPTFLNGLASLQLGVNNAIPSASAVTMSAFTSGSNRLTLGGHTDSIGSLTGTQSGGGTNTVDLGNNGALTTGGDNTTTSFSGTIQGSGKLIKTGSGSFDLAGANTFTGSTEIKTGTMLVDGSTASGDPITIDAGAILGGKGVIHDGAFPVGTATISPGSPPAVHTASLHIDGGVFFLANANSRYVVKLQGTAAGQFDQIDSSQASGAISLNGANLVISNVNPNLPVQSTFVIVKAGPSGLGGTFNGLPNNTPFTQATAKFRINYVEGANGTATLTFLGLTIRDVTGQVRIGYPSQYRAIGGGLFVGVFTIYNIGPDLAGPISINFAKLPPGVTMVKSTSVGFLASRRPVKIAVTFRNPGLVNLSPMPFLFPAQVLAGGGLG
jgi:autotransporter-associated beta strand protein